MSVGAITVNNAETGETADLRINGGGSLTSLGNISIDGDLTFANGIPTVKTIGTISANSILSAGVTIGSGGAGTSIRLISLATGAASGPTVFQFATMNGATTGLPAATLVLNFADATTDVTAAQALTNDGVTNLSGGVRMNML